MSSRDFIRPIDYVDVGKYNHTKTRDRGIRLYCSLSPQDLVALRAEIDAAITEVEEVYPHATAPRYASNTAGSPATRGGHTKKRGAQ